MEDSQLAVFNAISKFVSCLNDCYGPKQLSLQLYNTLLTKTTLSHKEAIDKHVKLFKIFCIDNQQSILDKNSDNMHNYVIEYSDKIKIDFEQIFELADKSEKAVIWNHILIICAYLNPQIRAKEILMKDKDNTNESNFLTDIINTVEQNVGNDVNDPMKAVGDIMSSGVFTNLVGNMTSGLQNGELDLSKLVGTVNNMVGTLVKDASGDTGGMPPEMGAMMNNLNSMMGQMTNKMKEDK
tara:strand:+ start:462 stop:1178 length:717 start_codon:yes stop_codon:yes gene_type:complete